ncbi:hypothetical protein EGW08_012110 [Elysia chlorotica]|uniref:USP domain-containing protein n=1 Tax=Elysia chlorotica TaxID=188477 RepID=A0A433TEY5_ELYCH|nr:hypothetical protein EGW08_012110 [Elysia chlorotica]
MTVEETPLQPVHAGQQQRLRDESLSLTLAKVHEVTGASDEVIREAIRVCSCKDGTFKVEDVVTTIIGDDTAAPTPSLKTLKPQAADDVDAKGGNPSSGLSGPAVAGGNQGSQAGQRKSTSSAAGGWKQAPQANDYIDLTRDSQGILGGQISREEQDISRVLEASLAESKGSTKRKRGEIWFQDPLNPHERKRADGWPVGLRNVGNTCWFSAVIQSLFHIHKFRNIVLNYKNCPLPEHETNHKLRFVCELRQLFGLMVGSHRKYVDPSMAVNILKEASATTALDGQQDVSEFQHKLLDWLEDAFSVPAGSSSTSSTSSTSMATPNPVHQLFQGKYKAEGFNQGKAFSQEVTFGQYPLNVLGFRDIHESLEATTGQGEIETVSGDSSHTSGQEIWFTHLPVVLTFELSRFGFNQQLNRAEKIHQELNFPPVIYIDRYLECNKTVTRQKREEARKLKEELAALQARLDRFLNYGSNNKRYPLPDVLQYALEFAESSPGGRRSVWPSEGRAGSNTCTDVEMRTPTTDPQSTCSTSATVCLTPVVVDPSPLTPGGCSGALSAVPPHPRSCSSEELVVLQACLRRWRQEVETDVRELQKKISTLEGKLKGMYSEDCMKKFPYHLHAVLVHEGQAVSGHYWSFIHDWHSATITTATNRNRKSGSLGAGDDGDAGRGGGDGGRWLKFNDITVSESSLDEVQKEGVGGHHNASAYCLMYIDRSRLEEDQGDANSSAAANSEATLPADLQRVVREDNSVFQQEMLTWDAEQRQRKASGPPHSSPAHTGVSSPSSSSASSTPGAGVGSVSTSGGQRSLSSAGTQAGSRLSAEGRGQGSGRSLSGDSDVVMTGEQRPGETTIMRPVNSAIAALADAHARLSLQATLTSVTDTLAARGTPPGNPRDIFMGAMEREMARLKALAQTLPSRLPEEDPRLTHIVVFLLTSGADVNTVKVILAEQFALCGLLDTTSIVKGLRHEAQESYKALYAYGGAEGVRHYEFWHKRYNHYRQAVFMFTEGVSAYMSKKYSEALPYFNQACLHSLEPDLTTSSPRHTSTGGLDPAWLAHYRRDTLKRVNEQALQSFERDDDLSDSLTIMTRQILPTLAMVGGSDLPEDQALVEGIRGVWCQFLEKDLTEEKVDKLQDFLSKMFEAGGSSTETLHKVRSQYLDQLFERYTRTLRRVKDAGGLDLLLSLSS